MSLYNFRRFTHCDLPMAAHWLQQAEVARWWGDPAKELAVITEDLNEPMMRQWVVEYRGRPFGYAQTYPVHAWPQSHFKHLPDEAKAIDAFIGEPDMLGCGHGRAFLRVFAEMLIAEGAPLVDRSEPGQSSCSPGLCSSRIRCGKGGRDRGRTVSSDALPANSGTVLIYRPTGGR